MKLILITLLSLAPSLASADSLLGDVCTEGLEPAVILASRASESVRNQALQNVLLYESIMIQNPGQLSLPIIQKSLKHHQSEPLLHPLDYAVSVCIEKHLETFSIERSYALLKRLELKLKGDEK